MLDQREETVDGRGRVRILVVARSLGGEQDVRHRRYVHLDVEPRSYLLQLAQASDDGHEHRFLGFLPEVPVDALIGLASCGVAHDGVDGDEHLQIVARVLERVVAVAVGRILGVENLHHAVVPHEVRQHPLHGRALRVREMVMLEGAGGRQNRRSAGTNR